MQKNERTPAAIAQEKWEEKGSRERWMQLMGKNYR